MHEYTSTVRIWELTCPGLLEEVRRARRWTRDILHGTPCAEDAALITTELGTNALLHTSSGNGASSFRLIVVRSATSVIVSVTDWGRTTTAPRLKSPDHDTTHGRGLALVHALARQVDIHGDDDHGHTVTAELPCTPVESTDPRDITPH